MTTAPDTDPRSLPSDADEPGGSPSTAAGTGGSGDGVDWLSAHEETVWRRWLAVSSRIPAALSSQLQSDSGLSLQDYDVLVMLNDSESSSCRITELAGLLDSAGRSVVIDHHASNPGFGEVRLVDPQAAASVSSATKASVCVRERFTGTP